MDNQLLTIYSSKISILVAHACQFDIDNHWRLWSQELFALYPHGCKLPFSTRNQNLPWLFLRAWPSGGSWLSWVSGRIYLLFKNRPRWRLLTTCYWMWNNPSSHLCAYSGGVCHFDCTKCWWQLECPKFLRIGDRKYPKINSHSASFSSHQSLNMDLNPCASCGDEGKKAMSLTYIS